MQFAPLKHCALTVTVCSNPGVFDSHREMEIGSILSIGILVLGSNLIVAIVAASINNQHSDPQHILEVDLPRTV